MKTCGQNCIAEPDYCPGSNDASLRSLSVSPGALSPAFSPSVTMYTLTVPAFVGSVQVQAAPSDPGTTLTANGVPLAADGASVPLTSESSVTMLEVIGRASGGATQRYTIVVMRSPATSLYVKASNTDVEDWFGYCLSLSGDTLAVGAALEDSGSGGIGGNQTNDGAIDSGSVYVFQRSGSTWTQQAYIKASNTEAGDNFGCPISLSGDTLAVAAGQEDSNATGVGGNQANNGASNSGAVYVFQRSGSIWTQQAYIKASNTEADDGFGYGVSVSGDTLAVGAPREDSNATGIGGNQADNSASNSGAVYVFQRSGSIWTQQAYLKASNTGTDDYFGWVSLSGDTLAVGANGESSNATGIGGNQADNSASGSGAVYVFQRSGSIWAQQAYIKASNAEFGDYFGGRPSLSGDTLAVGATGEDSNATGIGGNQADNSAIDSGAVYVFHRDGVTWTQQAYIKASNPDYQDWFGESVSLSGDTLAVGTEREGSNATGIGGNQADNSARDSGAVYMFQRSGSTWIQQAYVKATNTDAQDGFGGTVSLSGDTLAVGAYHESSNAMGIGGNQADNSARSSGAVYVFR